MQQPEKNEHAWTSADEQDQYRRYSRRQHHYLVQKVKELGPCFSGEKFQPLQEQVNTLMLSELDSNMGYEQIAGRLMATVHRLHRSIHPEKQSPALVKQLLEQAGLQAILAEFFYFQAMNGHRV